MLNTQYAGSGIDISCATDIVLFHSMAHKSEQAIGRAQRVGRTTQLTVHRLCYPHELALGG
jgi:SNF2 family DNA or RNA helicase